MGVSPTWIALISTGPIPTARRMRIQSLPGSVYQPIAGGNTRCAPNTSGTTWPRWAVLPMPWSVGEIPPTLPPSGPSGLSARDTRPKPVTARPMAWGMVRPPMNPPTAPKAVAIPPPIAAAPGIEASWARIPTTMAAAAPTRGVWSSSGSAAASQRHQPRTRCPSTPSSRSTIAPVALRVCSSVSGPMRTPMWEGRAGSSSHRSATSPSRASSARTLCQRPSPSARRIARCALVESSAES